MTDQELKDLVARLAVLEEKLAVREVERAEIYKERAEIEKKRAEIEKERDEIYKKRAEKDARDFEEIKQIQRETALQMKETDRKLKEAGAQISGIGNNNGYYSETFFQDVFAKKKEFGGIKYDDMVPNFGIKDRTRKMEIDIALINGDSLALIEAKYRVHPEFIKEFAEERVGKFKTYFPEYKDYKIYLGVAGFSFDDTVLEKAKEYGVGIVKQNGDSVEIDAECLKAY